MLFVVSMKTFGQRLRHRRELMRLSQQKLADELTRLYGKGMPSSSTIAHWEADKNQRPPDPKKLENIAAYLRCSVQYLVDHPELGEKRGQIPVIGYVGGGDLVHRLSEEVVDWVDLPDNISSSDVQAYEVRGSALAPRYDDRDLLFVDTLQDTDPRELLEEECVCELDDGRLLLRRILPGTQPDLFTLIGCSGLTLIDAAVVRAWRVAYIMRAWKRR